MPVSPARQAAFRVLLRVEKTDAFVDEMLHGPLLAGLSARDVSLAAEIALGVLRYRGVLDSLLEQALSRPVAKLDAEVRTALRMGAYQMRYLDRVPDRAAVSESVELIKRGPKRSAFGLVNAVLRKLPIRAAGDETDLAVPDWLLSRWRQAHGDQTAREMAAASLRRPATYVRVASAVDPSEAIQRLEAEGVHVEPTEIPRALRTTLGRVDQTALWREGLVRIQDLGAQLIVPLLELDETRRLLDLCAAPGGKTVQAADLQGTQRKIVAADLYLHRLSKMRELVGTQFQMTVLDAAVPLPFGRVFDRVLVDAPCSGTGTLGRNPDLKWRLRDSDLPRLVERQRLILANALEVVSRPGMAVYATCSVEPEENLAVVEAVLGGRRDWKIGRTLQRLPGRNEGDGFFAAQILAQ